MYVCTSDKVRLAPFRDTPHQCGSAKPTKVSPRFQPSLHAAPLGVARYRRGSFVIYLTETSCEDWDSQVLDPCLHNFIALYYVKCSLKEY